MVSMTLEIPEGAFASLHKSPDEFGREMRLAAAVKWYELELVSQGRAAEIAGVSRSEFLSALERYQVTPFQYSAEDAIKDARRE